MTTTLTRMTLAAAIALLVVLGVPQSRAQVKDIGPCGKAPPPKPAQASGSEGFPPLPLPVVPQRRTEKKLPPKPPVIITKIVTGSELDWATDPNDVNNLLVWMKSNLKVNFTHEEKRLGEMNLESGNVPVIYRTGHHAFQFSAEERQRVREYLLNGGMIIFDACCGRPEFAQAARSEIAAILPDYPLKPIPVDHPIYNCYYEKAGLVRFTPHSLAQDTSLRSPGPARLEGVEIACRMAVVFSPLDLSSGWDMHTHSTPGSTYIESEDALKIGANLMAYATATRDMSTSLAEAKAYKDADAHKTDKFQIGQLVHEGDWNPDPVGLRNMLDTVAQTTALKVSFETVPVQANPKELTRYPFLYITGHADFKWDDKQVAALRQYLANGGFILADACCGRQAFDLAFRREIGKVLGNDAALQQLPLKHPMLQMHHAITEVRTTEATRYRQRGQTLTTPKLFGAAIDGRVAVVYSPIALNVGWRLKPVPYAVSYEPTSALKIGTNVILYALTH